MEYGSHLSNGAISCGVKNSFSLVSSSAYVTEASFLPPAIGYFHADSVQSNRLAIDEEQELADIRSGDNP
jgi:hypothetical protein